MPPTELPLGWPSILRALIAGPGLWATPDELVERTGLGRRYKRRKAFSTVVERCVAMLAAGWLEGEANGRDACVTLSMRAAERLSVRIADDGPPSWVGFDLRRLPVVRYYAFTPDRLSVFFEVPDTSLGPEAAAIEAEELHVRPAGVSPASLQVGRHWIWLWRHDPCPVGCGNVRLQPGEHCLGCGRPHYERPE